MWVTWAPIWNSATIWPSPAFGSWAVDAVERGARGVRLDIHDHRRQAGRFGDRDPVLDLFACAMRPA